MPWPQKLPSNNTGTAGAFAILSKVTFWVPAVSPEVLVSLYAFLFVRPCIYASSPNRLVNFSNVLAATQCTGIAEVLHFAPHCWFNERVALTRGFILFGCLCAPHSRLVLPGNCAPSVNPGHLLYIRSDYEKCAKRSSE